MLGSKLLVIALMVGIDAIIFICLRAYQRRGRIMAFPANIDRSKTPRWYAFNLALGWLSFAAAVLFTLMVTIFLLTASSNA